MESIKTYDLLDRTGIETLFEAMPVPLPKLDAATLQSRFDIDDDLVQSDAALNQTWRTLSEPEAVVRVHRHGLETDAAVFWVLVRAGRLIQLSSDLQPSPTLRLSTLADATALLDGIERLLPMPAMPVEAYTRAMPDRSDAEDVFDLSQGSGLNVGSELLVSDGLTEEDARVAFDTIRSASVAGRISFVAVSEKEVVLTCGIAAGKAGALHGKLVDGWTLLGMD